MSSKWNVFLYYMQYSGAVVIKFLILTALSISYTDNYETVKYGVLQIELTSYHDNQQMFCNRVQIFNDFVLCAEILNFEGGVRNWIYYVSINIRLFLGTKTLKCLEKFAQNNTNLMRWENEICCRVRDSSLGVTVLLTIVLYFGIQICCLWRYGGSRGLLQHVKKNWHYVRSSVRFIFLFPLSAAL